MNARPPPQQLPALSPNGYSALVLAVFRAEADEEVAGSFFAAVPGLPGSGARVQAGTRCGRLFMARGVCGGGR
jgi:hypothetical protein